MQTLSTRRQRETAEKIRLILVLLFCFFAFSVLRTSTCLFRVTKINCWQRYLLSGRGSKEVGIFPEKSPADYNLARRWGFTPLPIQD
jgi:hypothetical protein